MAEQILHGSNVVTAAEQGRRERVAEGVRCGGLRDACLFYGTFEGALKKTISGSFSTKDMATLYRGPCLDFLKTIPNESVQLIVTSPPYNIGKEYEKKISIDEYVSQQSEVISECFRVLKPEGSICWQVGNHVKSSEIFPLDIILYPVFKNLGLKLRNRIIWHFEHGLHCSKRFSGRYETIMWYDVITSGVIT